MIHIYYDHIYHLDTSNNIEIQTQKWKLILNIGFYVEVLLLIQILFKNVSGTNNNSKQEILKYTLTEKQTNKIKHVSWWKLFNDSKYIYFEGNTNFRFLHQRYLSVVEDSPHPPSVALSLIR